MSTNVRGSAREALDRIPTGAEIISAPGMGAPTSVLAELGEASVGRKWRLSSGLLLDRYPFLGAVDAGELRYRTWHVMPAVRDRVASGNVGYVAARASQLSPLLERWRPTAAMVRVSPPNADGYCSLGPSVSYGTAALDAATLRIAEVDMAVPRTHGDCLVHMSIFDSMVETEHPIPEYAGAATDEVSAMIAAHVLSLLPPKPTLQVGIGGIPEGLVRSLGDADLGTIRFVGMATDDMVDLFEAGVVDSRIEDGIPAILSPDMMCTAKLLAFSHENPAIGMFPSAVSHDAARLGRIERFVSVNTAVEVDLFGNVNSEAIGGRQISGAGGSLDYVETATRSVGGFSVIAMPSTSRDGAFSKIVPAVETVTIPRTMVDYVVTEFGVARLSGLTLGERAEALAAIAHPDHRDALREAAHP